MVTRLPSIGKSSRDESGQGKGESVTIEEESDYRASGLTAGGNRWELRILLRIFGDSVVDVRRSGTASDL